MGYITKKIKNLELNYEKHFGTKKEKDYFKVNPSYVIPEITILINEKSFLPVDIVNSYLVHRFLTERKNSDFECRALRLYFDFIDEVGIGWDQGSDYIHKRPLSMFGKFLKDTFENGDISGTTAISYFNSVSRFYKYYLSIGHKFNGIPVTYIQKSIKTFSNSLKNHINEFEVEIDIADCKPNIPNQSKSSQLKPFSNNDYKVLFNALKNNSTKELMLICLLSANTGLRSNEIADLKLDMITSYSGEDYFDLYVGPQVRHKTKGNKNGIIRVSGKIMYLLNRYVKSTGYLKRLRKYNGERPPVFITVRGNSFTTQTISVMFSTLVKDFIKNNNSEFDYKFHDLRVHFGVNTMKACLDSKMSREQALAYVQNQMRHKDIKTTTEYLEYWTHSVVIEKRTELQDSVLNDIYNNLGK